MTAPASIYPQIGVPGLFDAAGLRTRCPVDVSAAVFVDNFKDHAQGGRWFYWDRDSTASDDGATVFKVNDITTGRWRRAEIRIVNSWAKTLSAIIGSDKAEWHKDADDGAASTATAERAFFYAQYGRTISRIAIIPTGALTAHDSNYANIIVSKRSADGLTKTTLATVSTTTGGTGNWSAFVEEPYAALSADASEIGAGEQLTLEITKSGTGVVVPTFELIVEFSDPRIDYTSIYYDDAADAAAATTTAEKCFAAVQERRVMARILFIPNAALTANGTDYATITIKKRDSAGANPATVVAKTTQAGSWVAHVPIDFGALSVTELLAGEQLTWTVAKAGSGVVVPAGLLIVVYDRPQVRAPDGWHKDALDAAASTVTAEKAFARNSTGNRRVVNAVKYIPAAALTANDTNYATLTVSKKPRGGGSSAIVATQTTKITGGSGNWSAHVPVSIPLTAANVMIDDGDILTIDIAKAASGVAVPQGQIHMEYQQLP